jgi:2,3-dihydroxy-2,3-dihydro-p-cumate dehydrogenase
VIAFVGDLSEPGCADGLAETARTEFGRIDTLVNNAAALVRMPFLDMTEDVMQQAVDGNWWQMVRSTRAVLPTMIEQQYGRIVGIGGGTGVPFHTFLLGVGKGAMLGFTKSLAAEVATDGITVNVVAPTAFEADNDGDPERMPRTQRPDWTPPGVLEALGAWAAPQRGVGRPAHPSEIAAAVAFIGSPEASYITGHQLDVSGGA